MLKFKKKREESKIGWARYERSMLASKLAKEGGKEEVREERETITKKSKLKINGNEALLLTFQILAAKHHGIRWMSIAITFRR